MCALSLNKHTRVLVLLGSNDYLDKNVRFNLWGEQPFVPNLAKLSPTFQNKLNCGFGIQENNLKE